MSDAAQLANAHHGLERTCMLHTKMSHDTSTTFSDAAARVKLQLSIELVALKRGGNPPAISHFTISHKQLVKSSEKDTLEPSSWSSKPTLNAMSMCFDSQFQGHLKRFAEVVNKHAQRLILVCMSGAKQANREVSSNNNL